MHSLLRDSEEIEIYSRSQCWITSWHSPTEPPIGKKYGSAGLCMNDGKIVVISTDGESWDFPAGRPEGDEDWEQTLRREMLEEACAVVTEARLLGFCRGLRREDDKIDLPVVRSIWLAQVDLLDWNPQFEIRFRELLPPLEAINRVLPEYEPLWWRAYHEAGLD